MRTETPYGSRAASAAAVLLAVALATGACGHKEPPIPPPRMIPATTNALRAHQRGMEAVLEFPYPTTTLRGAVLSGLERVDVYQFEKALPADAVELQREDMVEYEERLAEYREAMARLAPPTVPEGTAAESPAPDTAPEAEPPPAPETEAEPSTEAPRHPGPAPTLADLVQVDPRTFAREAVLVRSLAGEELEAAVLGSDLLLRLPLGELPEAGATGYVFAVRTTSLAGLESSLSNLARLVLEPPPPAPTSLAITPQPRGIELAWTADEDPAAGFKVYRRDAQARAYTDAVGSPPATARTHTDFGAVLEGRYIYAVTAVAVTEPLVESALSVEREIYHQDRYPPAAPAEVAAFPEEGRVRVIWAPPADEDVAGYVVYRRSEGGNAQALSEEPAPGLEYLDATAPPASILLYAVVAVDTHGNRSDASAEVRVRVP